MPSPNQSDPFFYFAVADGNAPLLKEEIQRTHPELKLAYSRKTFLTYKVSHPVKPHDDPGVVFAYSSGITLGRANSAELIPALTQLLKGPTFFKKPIFNSFGCEAVHREIAAALKGRFKESDFKDSDLVLEVIQSHENEFYFGIHGYGPHRTILNDYADPVVPSRAYHKIREAFLLMGLTPQAGQTVLDLGAAPGGASFYFLSHGLKVCAVDPADMHELCTKNPLLEHRRLSIDKFGDLQIAKRSFDWITLDINLDPPYLAHELERILKLLAQPPRGLFFTVKQTKKFSRERIPEFVSIVRSLGFRRAVAKQVPSNKSEFLLFATNGDDKVAPGA